MQSTMPASRGTNFCCFLPYMKYPRPIDPKSMEHISVVPISIRSFHIPPNLVVGRCRRTLIASGSEDLQVEHPVCGRQSSAFHFHPTLARVQGPALVRDQVVQVRQAG